MILKDEIRGFEYEMVGLLLNRKSTNEIPKRNFIEASVLEFFELPEDLKKRRKQAEPRANGGFLNLLPIKQPKMWSS